MISKISSKRNLYIIGIIIFTLIMILNTITPMVADDYAYMYSIYDYDLRITSIKEIVQSIHSHYYIMNGRSIAHFLVQLFLLWGKPIFNIINSFIFLWLGILIYTFGNYKKRTNIFLYVIINMLMWIFIPDFGQTVLWLDGACNYMWGTTAILSFLLVYRIYMQDQFKFKSGVWNLIMIFLGAIAGGYNENTSAACIFGSMIFVVIYKVRKIKVPLWSYFGIASAIISFIIMILAPGNFSRLEASSGSADKITSILNNFTTCNSRLIEYVGILLIIYFVLLIWNIKKKNNYEDILLSAILIIIGLSANYAMIASPSYPPRAMFGVITFVIASCVVLIKKCNINLISIVTITLIIVSAVIYVEAVKDSNRVKELFDEREKFIIEQRENGVMDITTFAIKTSNNYCALYDLSDVSEDKGYWMNTNLAKYYNVNSIRSDSTKE